MERLDQTHPSTPQGTQVDVEALRAHLMRPNPAWSNHMIDNADLLSLLDRLKESLAAKEAAERELKEMGTRWATECGETYTAELERDQLKAFVESIRDDGEMLDAQRAGDLLRALADPGASQVTRQDGGGEG